jgi:hypothetical protein
MKTHYTLFLF